MIQEMMKCIVIFLTMVTMTPKIAAQNQTTDSAAPGIVLYRNGKLLSNGPQSPATALIGVSALNGFSGTIQTSCFVRDPSGNTDRPCSVSPSQLQIGPSGAQISLSVPTQGLTPGNYTIEVSAVEVGVIGGDPITFPLTPPCTILDSNCVIYSGSPACGLEFPPPPECLQSPAPVSSAPPRVVSASQFLYLSIPQPATAKVSGGSFGAWFCFGLLVILWAWRYKKDVKQPSLI
jgi:hypothetical protein